MELVYHYHTLGEAEEISRTFHSWIGKKAHIGLGKQETLQEIIIKPGQQITVAEKTEAGYYIEFRFESKTLNVYEFTIGNGLMPITGTLLVAELKKAIAPYFNSMFSNGLSST